ncbi:hypothetical protein O979_08085 [Mycobacterium avium subsp. paratuberculosis 10-4404]|nr:hypothetical protein O984_09580 [Mycobacterium avium 05-4293]ETA99057.1 hypothetical protein O982_08360 [Mycobacterium avium 10-5581]ETB04013.1 hypothetical protein O979_08085 [Mycobacterium avium subsp. paratuberculosis 10-4404]ETB05325.1 hypothetical protein O978_08305 [Mycobacterium avium subsp. paratuberculosis 10-5864]ETB12802.1 hypothetical protein O980_07910 [Mycobacterium avium subsp. paratuberculosis 08-8281]ETB41052.1 hypothetical protein O975_08910 [Mycobacterium avium subsp. par
MNPHAAGPAWLFCPADRPERFAKQPRPPTW